MNHGGHSAQVKMRLLVGDCSLAVTQMGPDFLLMANPINRSPANATLVLLVDQTERRWQVRLPDGISAASKPVAIAPC
jgi:hypothetical protein